MVAATKFFAQNIIARAISARPLNTRDVPDNSGIFDPKDIFTPSVKGAIYDYDDFSYLSQKADGSVPVTALEQPLGLLMDKRWGGARGDELKATGAVGLQGAATVATYNTSTSVGAASRVDATNQSFVKLTVTAGRFYAVSLTNTGANTVFIRDLVGASTVSAALAAVAAGASFSGFVLAANGLCICSGTNAATSTFTISSVREIPGLHAYQTTDTARPVISARYNLLTASQNYSSASWYKVDITPTSGQASPDGGTTATLITEGSAGTSTVSQAVPTVAAQSYTITRYLKRGNTDWLAIVATDNTAGANFFRTFVNLATGALGTGGASGNGTLISHAIRSLGNGWYEVKLTGTLATATTIATTTRTATSGDTNVRVSGGSYVLWGADLRLTADANSRIPAYQCVTTATDYDSAGFPRFLRIDATDDFLQTASVDPGTDKVFVCAGVTKMSDAASACVIESSATYSTNNGAFALFAPQTPVSNVQFNSKGTSPSSAIRAPIASPATFVASGIASISDDSTGIRVNGVAGYAVPTDQGTGNYTAQPLYIGARAGTSLRLNNGRIYPMVICFKAVTAGEIAATEAWVNQRTKGF